MKSLFAVSFTAFLMIMVTGCGDDKVVGSPSSDVLADTSEIGDAVTVRYNDTTEDVFEDTGMTEDTVDATTNDADSTSGDTSVFPEQDVAQDLPADPTEDPEGGDNASFYEFPEWEIPTPDQNKEDDR